MFTLPRDVECVTRLLVDFPDRRVLTWQWADRATEFISGSPLHVSFSSNHVKALVIDEGVAFVV
jgi:hypothetical protein